MKKRIEFSVIVCTRNRVDYLKRCIISLLTQTYRPKEIIIVDDASDQELNVYEFFQNEVSKIIYEMRGRMRSVSLIIIRNKHNSGIVASRNTGIKASKGDVLAFLDDDCYAHPSWLSGLAKAYTPGVLGVGGPVVEMGRKMVTPEKKVKRLAYIRNGKIITKFRIARLEDAGLLPSAKVPFLQGGNMSYRKSVLLLVNGGDVNLKGNGYREETDMGLTISRRGELRFEPSAITFHETAMVGGSRDLIRFSLDRFLYYMHRNTTYFFFKNFNFWKAVDITQKGIRRQINLLRKHRTGLTRDYLKIKSRKRSIMSVLCGSASGVINWVLSCISKQRSLVHSEIESLNSFSFDPDNKIAILEELNSAELFRRFQ